MGNAYRRCHVCIQEIGDFPLNQTLTEVRMGKKIEKLQRVVKKLAARYGEDDSDLQRLQSALALLKEDKQLQQERRRFGPAGVAFLTPAKRIYYESRTEDLH